MALICPPVGPLFVWPPPPRHGLSTVQGGISCSRPWHGVVRLSSQPTPALGHVGQQGPRVLGEGGGSCHNPPNSAQPVGWWSWTPPPAPQGRHWGVGCEGQAAVEGRGGHKQPPPGVQHSTGALPTTHPVLLRRGAASPTLGTPRFCHSPRWVRGARDGQGGPVAAGSRLVFINQRVFAALSTSAPALGLPLPAAPPPPPLHAHPQGWPRGSWGTPFIPQPPPHPQKKGTPLTC